MEEKTVSIQNLKTNYKICGKGENLLILHGWGGSSDSWKKMIEILGLKFRVICPDFPGFGKTDQPKETWNLDRFVAWLKDFVDTLSLKDFFMLGHSFGGRVAIKFTILYPQRIKKLLLLNSAGIKKELTFKEKIIINLAKTGKKIISPFKFKNKIQQIFYFLFGIGDYSKAEGVMKETMKAIIKEDLLPQLSHIKKETIIIWGEKDKIVPLKYGMLLKEKITGSKIEIIPKTGHSPHLENPEKLFEVLISHLK